MNDLAALDVPVAPTPRRFLDGPAIVALLRKVGVRVSPDVIRKWAERGTVTRHGYDDRGRVLYDVQEVSQMAQKHRPRAVA